MRTKTIALAASLTLALSGAALAQTAAGGGSAEGNVNNPGSVKSNSEKGMERTTGSATGSTTGSTGRGMGTTNSMGGTTGSMGGTTGGNSMGASGPSGR